jgi:hypothetical protein
VIREEVVIRRLTWLALRSVLGTPYRVHNNCELVLMREPRVRRLVIIYEPLEVVAWARRAGLLWRYWPSPFSGS